jgi:4'-phosphopantetheinyl transferase
MINIYYAYTDILQGTDTDIFMKELSPQTKSKLSHLKRDGDRHLLVTSLVLLSKALYENGHNNSKLSDLQYSEAGRPLFKESPFDFNISHTDKCAAVVFSNDCRVGIDIEKTKGIDLSDFTDYFTSEQWDDIYSAKDRYKRFYYYWTMIESAVKADGRGLSLISTNAVKLINGDLFIDNVQWFYNHYELGPMISCCVTTGKKDKQYEIKNIRSI